MSICDVKGLFEIVTEYLNEKLYIGYRIIFLLVYTNNLSLL